MIYNPIPSLPPSTIPLVLSFCVNFLFDGAVFLLVLGLYTRFRKRTITGPKGDIRDSLATPTFTTLEIILRILLHVFVGYGADAVGASLRIHGEVDLNWLILAATLGLFQGIALKITLNAKLLPRSLNLWLGVILFSILTNPYIFSFLLPI